MGFLDPECLGCGHPASPQPFGCGAQHREPQRPRPGWCSQPLAAASGQLQRGGHPLSTATTRVAACPLQLPGCPSQLPCVSWGWLVAGWQPMSSIVGTRLGHGVPAGAGAVGAASALVGCRAGLPGCWVLFGLSGSPTGHGSGTESGLRGVWGGPGQKSAPVPGV